MSEDGPSHNTEILVTLPVYNERASIRKVVKEWFDEIGNWTGNFVLLAINDGSKDDTNDILHSLKEELGERLEIINRENRGHGQSCLEGYRTAVNRNIPFVLQIDSDGQCDPQYFSLFWQARNSFDAIFGVRKQRDDGWRRVVASSILKGFLFFTERVYLPDANVPYRLIRTSHLSNILPLIPGDFFLVNIALAVLLQIQAETRHKFINIRFRVRYGGEPTIKLAAFGSKAIQLHKQMRKIKSLQNSID